MTSPIMREPDREARSPWSNYNDIQEVRIEPLKHPADGIITVPGSKSLTNRALIIAALAEGTSTLEGILRSDDSYWCIHALQDLGISVKVSGDTALVEGAGGNWPIHQGDLYVGAAGTIARFMPGALAVGTGNWRMSGSKRMSERPLAPLLDALAGLGADIQYADDGKRGCLPFNIHANGLRGGEVRLSGAVTSQFISGLLLAAPYAQEALTLRIDGPVVQRDYVELTLEMMREFGINPEVQDGGETIIVNPGRYQARTSQLEPDVSTCGYFWAMAALTSGRIRINGIDSGTRQPDIELLDILEQMGCLVTRGDGYVEIQGPEKLKGGFTINLQSLSDQTPTVALLALFADGPITITGVAHIRHHESDRIAAICSELSKLGIAVKEHEDGLTIHPGTPQPALLDPHDDHRMAMALSLIGTKVPGIRIADPGCVSKTCPDFFDRLQALGAAVEHITTSSALEVRPPSRYLQADKPKSGNK